MGWLLEILWFLVGEAVTRVIESFVLTLAATIW